MHPYIEAPIDTRSPTPRPAPKLDTLAGATSRTGANVYLQTVLPTRCLPMPVRRDVDKYLYVVHGELDVWVGPQHAKVTAGMSIALPHGTPHRIGNFTRQPAKALVVATRESCVYEFRRSDATRLGAPANGSVSALVTPGAVEVSIG